MLSADKALERNGDGPETAEGGWSAGAARSPPEAENAMCKAPERCSPLSWLKGQSHFTESAVGKRSNEMI